ncbi:MAG: acyl-CoA dehydrogenase domain protein [Phenylobacterium sp.]|nr:acyl-CoA dehydrogenase domain protein [Phenylobacterium sp.]
MNFDFTEEQVLLKDTLTRFLRDRYDLEARTKAVCSGEGWRPDVWTAFADELGILGITTPEAAGGLDGGAVEAMIVMEAIGEWLVIEPFLETVVIGAGILKRIEAAEARPLLEKIVAGAARVAFAWAEPGARYSPGEVATVARLDDGRWRLSGDKSVVVGARHATHLIVTARTSGERRDRRGVALFLVEKDAAGLSAHDYRTIDDRSAADLKFEDTSGVLLGEAGAALPLIDLVLDEAAAAVCAEAVGAMRQLLATTIAYANQRHQFGAPIGTFQALQHRIADMYLAVEQATSAVYLATLKLDLPAAERSRAVSAAKVTIGKTARFVGQQAVQLHGAMGMTEELTVGHYFKRLSVIEGEFGSADHHLARYARLTERPAA